MRKQGYDTRLSQREECRRVLADISKERKYAADVVAHTGMSFADLSKHLKLGPNGKRPRGYQVDHIKPLVSFTMENIHPANHYTKLEIASKARQ